MWGVKVEGVKFKYCRGKKATKNTVPSTITKCLYFPTLAYANRVRQKLLKQNKTKKLCFKLSFCLCLNLYGSESRYDTYGHFKLKASAVRKKKSRPPAVKAPVCEG